MLRELVGGRGAKLDVMVARFEAMGISSRPENRLRMISEFIYINWKIGIFWRRPVYQLTVLVLNAVKHGWRMVSRASQG